jgi:hypothetical protein
MKVAEKVRRREKEVGGLSPSDWGSTCLSSSSASKVDALQPTRIRNSMNHNNGWMFGTSGSGVEAWIWPVLGVLVMVLLVVLILKVSKI